MICSWLTVHQWGEFWRAVTTVFIADQSLHCSWHWAMVWPGFWSRLAKTTPYDAIMRSINDSREHTRKR